ncbi:transglycosylase SLT domain-containing protein [Sphingomonas sp. H39-1-10]|uniref:lytic transglycosylase domain-containing protein n=1 Tax=Sphingomonas pollutisoli TaxID=3030829 RepID=UPI0023BA02D9|nr:transglycosylase SLT domain-containing protein [Sphingomonas pollutisoli]MDF0490558.1 transglycosylase SLT domain-containing protein [Sphingomonas pollutisoli]
MRSILLTCVALSVGLCASEAGAGQRTKALRTVQVIVMGAGSATGTPPGEPPQMPTALADADDGRTPAPKPIPAGFRTHDLSRRWVAFEMANSFSAAATGQADSGDPDPFAHVGVAPLDPAPMNAAVPLPSSIAIPRWMREGVPFSSVPTSFAPGCSPRGYRPAGFLDARTESRRFGYYGMMSSIACEYGIPVGLFDAMIIRESGYDAGIYSAKNAFGLTQLMPGTAAGLGVDRYDVEQNLRGGARYLRQQLDRFGQVHLALAAYNAGPGRIRDGMLPRIVETHAYVENVLLNWQRLAGLSPRIRVQNITGVPATRPPVIGRSVTVTSY